MCEEILWGIDEIISCFRSFDNGDIYRTRKSEASTADHEVMLYVDNEIDNYLTYLGVEHNVEYISSNMVQAVLCISFCINGHLGTYNEPMYL